ncbi:hypothetical protein FISHEDRAFT_73429 [Fistulina hepatica ATCC 64428]|uniref:Uncharacterized protein n=1 Tax=Fistulina hepatica ATCC 64428 TaxID=1128425 RepID=A0A0D7AFG6_9AGAR|nr:hypothetical protein FISHEDRAFT_73429 [Fistulina hepatica ATCC 64428]
MPAASPVAKLPQHSLSHLPETSSLILDLTSDLLELISPHPTTNPDVQAFINNIRALVDSGSSHCFADAGFVKKYDIPTFFVPPVTLRLFDGSSTAMIKWAIHLPLRFPNIHEVIHIQCYVTTLDLSVSVVLGHNFLVHHNPTIDWTTGNIQFRQQPLPMPPAHPGPATTAPRDSTSEPSGVSATPGLWSPVLPAQADTDKKFSAQPSPLPSDPPSISLVSAAAYLRAAKVTGAKQFTLHPRFSKVYARAAGLGVDDDVPDTVPDLTWVPPEFHEFADVFNKTSADTLPDHRSYDLKIELEDGA